MGAPGRATVVVRRRCSPANGALRKTVPSGEWRRPVNGEVARQGVCRATWVATIEIKPSGIWVGRLVRGRPSI